MTSGQGTAGDLQSVPATKPHHHTTVVRAASFAVIADKSKPRVSAVGRNRRPSRGIRRFTTPHQAARYIAWLRDKTETTLISLGGMFRATSEYSCLQTYGFVAPECEARISDGLGRGCQQVKLRLSFRRVNLLAPELFFFNFSTSCI